MTMVKDTGIGIKNEDQRKLFKVFGKLSDPNKINKSGMGLGLTITKFIVEKLNGVLEMKSEYKIGTQFTFKFKLSN
jgi:signal transduction histidine kinase